MIWQYIGGICAVLFGIYEMAMSYKYVKVVQHTGNKTTSNFTVGTVWYSFALGLCILLLGIAIIFNKL